MPSAPPMTRHRSLVDRFFRDPDTDEVVVVQMPNIPLWLFLIATAVRTLVHPAGVLGTGVSLIAQVSLAVWAVLEIAKGESPFRRVLGAVVLIVGIVGYVLR